MIAARAPKRIAGGLTLLVASLACLPPQRAPRLDAEERLALYERAERTFGSAVLLAPALEAPDRDLAPLLLREVRDVGSPESASGDAQATVRVGLDEDRVVIDGVRLVRRTYAWTFPPTSGRAPTRQGIRAILGRDGFPLVYEALADSSGARLLFVSETLEAAAAAEFGSPFAGRRFAIERAVDDAPDVVVAGLFEPGPMPLGPFVYLTAAQGDVATVICRCMPSRVETVVDTREYRLERGAQAGTESVAAGGSSSPARWLRWPSSGF